MMHRYEVLMLAVPEITQDETKSIEKQIDSVVRQSNGSLISFERWGKYKLSYPVDRNDYGIYFLARFETDKAETALNEISSLFKIRLNNIVMRNMLTKLEPNQSLAYQRPKSLEDAPETTNSRGFMDERKKIEGLISAVDGKKGQVTDIDFEEMEEDTEFDDQE
ncbi:MAG TPA: 30S ribosomal protein S6 [Candidatus Dependentiae bacterium]|nr:30S ribosomal protein S6 [Candidatus Dependentiae bacterium]HRQ62861.1 30S ribosomal protein S6 [Candidatus Dependentiae bacterium]